MNPQDIEKLLGGYATDTLSDDERRTLFAAALTNQTLFDALADEQALKELLDDPPSRAHLLAALREHRPSLGARIAAWMRQPSSLALVGAVAAGIVAIAVVIPHSRVSEKPAAVAVNIAPRQEAQPVQPTMQPAPEPKAAPPAPAGSPSPAAAPKSVAGDRRQEPERDAAPAADTRALKDTVQPAGQASNAVINAPAAVPPPPPPPPPAAAPAPPVMVPAEARFKAEEAAPKQALKKEVAQAGAQQMYYAAQAQTQSGAAVGGLANQPRAAKSSPERFGRTMTLTRPAAAPAAPVIAGVRYSVLKKNLDGTFVEVEPSATFVPGDAVRVRLETNQSGYLSVMERQPDNSWTLRMTAQTKPGAPVFLPADSAISITNPGALHFFVRFSRSPRTGARMDSVAATPNLQRETAGNAAYIVNPIAAADPTVDFEITISAR